MTTCARCGKRLKDGGWIYSAWTKNRYCATNVNACGKRADRAKKKATNLREAA